MILLRRLLGDVLREHRREQGRTLREVSAAARVSLGYLSEVERGQKEASSELLASICDALELELADLLAEVSLELRVAGGGALRPLSAPGARPGETAAEVTPAAEQPALQPDMAPVAEPALALVAAGQPTRSGLRRGETVSLAA